MLNILKILFFLGLGIGLIWLALRKTTDEELANIKISLLNADYFWISLSIVITGLSHFFRALRWKLLLDPLGYKPKTSNTFFAVMVGYLANFAIHRMGEVTRCGLLTTYEKVPFTTGFGSVISERALDVVCLLLIFFAALGMEFDRISGIANDLVFNTVAEKFHALMQKQTFVIVAGVSLLILAIAFFYFRKKIQSLFSTKVKGVFAGIWNGLISIKNVNKPVLFILHTVLIWTMYVLQVYVCFFAFPETANLSIMVAVVIVVFGSLGVVATPGGTGAYQLIVIQILTSIYLISYTSSFAFAWAVWTSQFVFIVFTGFLSLILLALLNKVAKSEE
ncbi:MAG TPA: lysylphosphatidylglycerol synthase transmembrane domain-containing protein [Bacteroidia bacterium]|nr:lysylphosphatidylglycerol synthase transmembrane domain-containing protein [Bacteroidia bacterium]